MAYNKTIWSTGDTITATLKNKTETGIETNDIQLRNSQLENIGLGIQEGGLKVKASATPDMNVHVDAGTIYVVAGERYNFTTTKTIAINTADGTNPRKDLIYVSASGVITYTAGTPATSPTEPSLPSGALKLCVVDVPAGDTAIQGTQIIDKRIIKDKYNIYSSSKDANGKFTVVEYKKTDGTLHMKSTLSNADANGNYQTDTWDFYNLAGTTIIKTITWSFTYDADGAMTSKAVNA